MSEKGKTALRRILNEHRCGDPAYKYDVERLESELDRLQRVEELLERCKPAVKGYGWRFHQVGQHTIGDEWWGLEDEIETVLGGHHDD